MDKVTPEQLLQEGAAALARIHAIAAEPLELPRRGAPTGSGEVTTMTTRNRNDLVWL